MPRKRRKTRQKKRNKRGGDKAKRKVKAVVSIAQKLEILLSAHVRTLQANILHLDQKAASCRT